MQGHTLEHMEEQILKILLLSTKHRGAFVGCMYVLVCPKNSGYVTDKYITSISKKVYIDEVDDIFDKCNNIYHRIIKMKPIAVMSITCIGYDVENNDKDPKFKGGDHVKISKYKNIFAKGYTPN